MTKAKKSPSNTSKNFKSRGWFVTINNPADKGFTHDDIKTIICPLRIVYMCMSDEIGLEEKTPHTHVYILFQNPVSFSSMKNKFKGAHLDAVKGKPYGFS